MHPLVSVVMPMRNAEPYVLAALASVLAEQRVPIEVIVVDDGSTDRSRHLVASLTDSRIRLLSGPQRGIAACLNVGFQGALGRILMRCDADDLYPMHRISEQSDWLEAHPQHGAVCGPFGTIDKRGRLVSALGAGRDLAEDVDAELRAGITRTSLCTFAIRREVFGSAGLFREYFETSEDIDFLLRLGEVCRVGYVSRIRYLYRLHQSSITHVQATARREFFDHMARHFQVQRREQEADDLQRGHPAMPPELPTHESQSASRHVQGILVGQAWRALQEGARVPALRFMARAVGVSPTNAQAWRSLLVLAWRSLLPRRP